MATIVASANEKVRIRPHGRTTIIGERCNALGFRSVARAALKRDWTEVINRAKLQKQAGAHIINVNMVGVRDDDENDIPEKELLPQACAAILGAIDVPLSIDFGDPEALDAALQVVREISGPKSRTLINSNSAESAKRDRVFEIAKRHNAPLIAMTCDDRGIPVTAEERLTIARELIEHGQNKFGIPKDDFIFDCVCIGVGTDIDSKPGRTTMETLSLIKRELGCSCMLGASNTSFGLPRRKTLDGFYLAIAVYNGMNVALTDPTHEHIRWAILSADATTGSDKGCKQFLKTYREQRAQQAQVVEPEVVTSPMER